jgi:hypothetical protein
VIVEFKLSAASTDDTDRLQLLSGVGREVGMGTILIIILVIVLLGGGGGYYGYIEQHGWLSR